MNDTTKFNTIDTGFDEGDDNKLQEAMLENLERRYKEQLESGHNEDAVSTKEDIDALRAHMKQDNKHDPQDKTPDDLDV